MYTTLVSIYCYLKSIIELQLESVVNISRSYKYYLHVVGFLLLVSDAGVQAGEQERTQWLRIMYFNAGRDSCDNLSELLYHRPRFPHTNAKAVLPPSQQGFGGRKGAVGAAVFPTAGTADSRHHGVCLTGKCPAQASPKTAHFFISEYQLFHSKLLCILCRSS